MIKGGLRNITSPNFPVALPQYEQKFMDQFINVLRLNTNTLANAINSPKVFGSFYSNVRQTNAGVAAVNLITYNNTVVTYGTVVNSPGSRIYVSENGIYNLQFSVQLDKTGGAAADIYIWLRQNGVNVPNSAGKVVVQGANTELIAAWNYVVLLSANDYLEIAWASTDTAVVIEAFAAATGPPSIPAIPSVIVTICWVSNTPI